VKGARVAVLGLTFKENVPDLRNSRVPDIIHELETFGVVPLVHDPLADRAEARHEYGVDVVGKDSLVDLAGAVVAVGHREFVLDEGLFAGVRNGGVVVDVKGVVTTTQARGLTLWSL
jgi:UDP-N-acetyl-D-galactosamine dehydrogenase